MTQETVEGPHAISPVIGHVIDCRNHVTTSPEQMRPRRYTSADIENALWSALCKCLQRKTIFNRPLVVGFEHLAFKFSQTDPSDIPLATSANQRLQASKQRVPRYVDGRESSNISPILRAMFLEE